MTEPIVEVSITPSFILHDREYSENSVSYDPSTAVLMYQWNRALAEQQRRLVFPEVVDGHSLEVMVTRVPRDGEVVVQDGAILMPPLYHGEEYVAELTFYEPPTPAKPKLPKIKITTTIRGRPQGGG
jgi:hypothetical protein